MKLDYNLKTPEERIEYVNKLIDANSRTSRTSKRSKPSASQLELMSNYILFVGENITVRQREEEYPVVTKNREVTLNHRETSLEGTIDRLPGGEDSLWTVTSSSEYPLGVKEPLDLSKISEIPGGEAKLKVIHDLESQMAKATGFRRFKLKKAIIETWQDIYSTRISMNAAAGYATTPKLSPTLKTAGRIELPEHRWVTANGIPKSDSDFSLFEPTIVLLLLRHYFNLKSEVRNDLHCDMHYYLWELEIVARKALAEHPILLDLCRLEMLGYTGAEIVDYMETYHNIVHSEQYFSTLWTKKIPKLISEEAKKNFIIYYWRKNGLPFKTCSCCKKTLPANPFFFHRNTNSDGFYSKCKKCRKNNLKSQSKYAQDPFTGQVVEVRLLSLGYAPELIGGDDIYGR